MKNIDTVLVHIYLKEIQLSELFENDPKFCKTDNSTDLYILATQRQFLTEKTAVILL